MREGEIVSRMSNRNSNVTLIDMCSILEGDVFLFWVSSAPPKNLAREKVPLDARIDGEDRFRYNVCTWFWIDLPKRSVTWNEDAVRVLDRSQKHIQYNLWSKGSREIKEHNNRWNLIKNQWMSSLEISSCVDFNGSSSPRHSLSFFGYPLFRHGLHTVISWAVD